MVSAMALAWLQGGKALAQAQGETLIAAQLNNSGFTSATSYSRGGDMTVEGWVYPTSAGGPWTRFVELSTTTASLVNALNFITSFGDTGRPFMEIWVGSSQSTLVAPNALPLNTWSHVAYTIEGTTYRIYVNGGLVATGTGSAPSAVSRTLTIGRFRTGGSAIDGRVADIRIWSVARTAAQIDASKAWGSMTGPTTGLVACWALGQTGGDVLADSAGNMPLTEVGTVQYLKLLSGTNVTTAANTHAGTFTIQAGTYQVGNGGASGTLGTGNVVNNGTLAFNRSDAITPANAISGTGKIVQNGSGSLTLSGSKTFTGGIDVNSGVLRLGGPLSSVAGNTFTVGPSGTLSFSVGNVLGYATAAPANSIVVQGGGVVRNEGANQFNVLPSLTLNGGSLQATGTEAGYSYALRGGVTVNGGSNTATMSAQGMGLGATTVSGATFNVADGSADIDLLVSGTLIDGPSASWPTPQASFLTKTGAGSMVLSGANTYSGTTTISGGTLQVGNGGTTGTLGSGNVLNNATLTFNRSDTVAVANVISGTGALQKQGAGTLVLLGANTYSGASTVSAGILQVGNGGTSGALGSGNVINNAGLVFNRSDNISVPAVVEGSGTLTKQGAGTIALLGNNTYSGTTTIGGGTLQVGNGGTTGTLGTGDVVNNGNLAFQRGDNIAISTVISGTGSLAQQGSATLTLAANNTYSGNTTISGGTLQVGNGGTTGTLGTGNVVNNGTLAFNRSDAVTPANAISGTGKLVQNGSGSLTLSGSKTFTGGIDVNGGTLYAAGTLPAVAGNTLTVGPSATWSFSAADVLGNHSTVPANAIVVQAGGVVSNDGNNRFNLLPALTLNGGSIRANGTHLGYSYALRGNVTVNGGANTSTIEAQAVGLGSTALAGATFDVADGAADIDLLVSGTLVNGPSASWPTPQTSFLTKTGAGTMVLSGANTYSGTTTISGGTLQVGNGGASGTLGSGNVVNNGALAFQRSDNVAISSVISGTGALNKQGAATLTLAANNTYSGTTTIGGGTLQVGNGGTTGTLGTGNIVNNGSLAFHRSDNVTVSGVISGTGSLTQQGASTLTLAANNTYAGSTTISAGTLQVGNGGTTGTVGSGAIVNNGALILNRSDALVVSGAVTGSGSLTKSGAGTATLASGYSATGGVSIEAGTLFLSGATPFSASQVRVGGGAALDVSARPAGLALGAGQALANTAGTALVIGSLEASNGTLNLTFGLGTPAISVSNGMLALASTTTLRITNSGAPLPRGNYRIISKRDGGAVVGTVPSTVVEGGGIVSGGVASLTITGGELILTVKAFSSLATTTEPPETIFHQGFLVDAAGQPLGSPNPRNYDIAFRIYAAANGGTVLWGERQVVTVDAGRFAIHLGTGDPNAGDPLPSLPSLFAGAATGLYLETTIKGGGTGGDDLVLMPRSLIPPTPYAFLARHALGAVNLVNSSNQPVLAVVGSRVGIQQPAPNSTLDVRGSLRSTNLLGSGPATIGGTVIASEFRGRGIVPVGGIVAWSGANPPAGWALCDGRVVNGRRTPDLRGRFILGAGNASGLTPRAAGDIGGAETVTLATAHLPSHTHVLDIPPIDSAGGGGHNHVFQSGAGSSEGLGKDPSTAPWFGTGAFIMRRRTEWAGGHGHTVDLPGFTTARAGSSQPHNNLPPFYAMAFVMRVE